MAFVGSFAYAKHNTFSADIQVRGFILTILRQTVKMFIDLSIYQSVLLWLPEVVGNLMP